MRALTKTVVLQWRKQRWILLAAFAVLILSQLVFHVSWPGSRKVDVDFRVVKLAILLLGFAAGAAAGVFSLAEVPALSGDSGSVRRLVSLSLLKLASGAITALLANTILIFSMTAFYWGGWDFDGFSSGFLPECVDFNTLFFVGFVLAFACGAFISALRIRIFKAFVWSFLRTVRR